MKALCTSPHLIAHIVEELFQIKSLCAWEEVCGTSLFQLISNPVAVVLFLCLVLLVVRLGVALVLKFKLSRR